jgi:hypothetical protein
MPENREKSPQRDEQTKLEDLPPRQDDAAIEQDEVKGGVTLSDFTFTSKTDKPSPKLL